MTSASPTPSAGSSSPRIALPVDGIAPFDLGPFVWARHPMPFTSTTQGQGWQRALMTILVAWVPLVVLSALEGHAAPGASPRPLLIDLAVYGRYVVAAPVLAAAATILLPLLSSVIRHFAEIEMIDERDQPQYLALVESTRYLLCSRWVDAAIVTLAYTLTLTLSPLLYPASAASWVAPVDSTGAAHLSLAGWWRTLVSQPLFYTMGAVWLWRLILWMRFLWRIACMNLRLVAAHPDHMGGLRFVLLATRGFAILAFAFGAMGAGTVAQSVLIDGQPLESFRMLVGAQVLVGLVLFCGPPLLLMSQVQRLHAWGTLYYGGLATQVGQAFQRRWLTGTPAGDEALGVPDFSATTDLYGVVANISDINLWVIDARTVIWLVAATLVPYVPVVFATFPFDEILKFVFSAVA